MGHPYRRAVIGSWGIASLGLLLGLTLILGCRPVRKRAKREDVRAISLWHEPKRRAPLEPAAVSPPEEPPGFVHAKARFVWIRQKPDQDSAWLGYITLGQTIPLRRDPRGSVQGQGSVCNEWVPVAPKGWVCLGRDATLDAEDPIFRVLREHTADVSSPWPFQYARSLGAPRYRTLPTARDQHAKEGDVTALLARIDKARAAKGDPEIEVIDRRLVGAELAMTGDAPPAAFEPSHPIMETDEDVSLGSTIAYTYEFDYEDRAWLLGWDHAIIPQVRVKKYPRSSFRGIELDADIDLPLAFVKRQGAYMVRMNTDGIPVASSEMFPPHAMVELGEGTIEHEGRTLFATEEPGLYVSERDVVVVRPTASVPDDLSPMGRRTWIEVSTVGGWLVAYEGARPVYATAISAGRAALAPDGTMVPSSSTPSGTYTIKNKLKTATMRSDRRPDRAHAEVMYTQVFHEDYALHGAYWHDDWGDRRSAGCVNLSPIDSKWIFDWTEPSVPDGWHAKRVRGDEPTTVVVIHL